MKKILLITYLISCTCLVKAQYYANRRSQDEEDKLNKVYTHPTNYLKAAYSYVSKDAQFIEGKKLSKTQAWQRYHKHNFSKVLNNPLTNFRLGFIGANYERFRIHFSFIKQDQSIPELYHVSGKTKVKNTICSFTGTIRIRQLAVILNVKDYEEGAKHIGYLVAEYQFFEKKSQKHSGMLHGVTYYDWYVDDKNKIHYDKLMDGADGYCNAQAVGIWKSYATQQIKRCNWGDARIPLSLDIGDGEFWPDPQYEEYGWKDLGFSNDPKKQQEIEAARKEEEKEWWK